MKNILYLVVFIALMALALVSHKVVMGQTSTATPTTTATVTPQPSVVIPSGAPSTGRGM